MCVHMAQVRGRGNECVRTTPPERDKTWERGYVRACKNKILFFTIFAKLCTSENVPLYGITLLGPYQFNFYVTPARLTLILASVIQR